MTRCALQHFPLSSAYLCQDCNSVGNCARQCPACASCVLMNLSTVLDRDVEQESHLVVDYPFPVSVAQSIIELEAMVA